MLSRISIGSAFQKLAIVFERLADIVLRLTERDVFRYELADSCSAQNYAVALIRLLLGHDGAYRLCRQLVLLEQLTHTYRLFMRRRAVVAIYLVDDIALTVLVEI